jgi:hypothetical protein
MKRTIIIAVVVVMLVPRNLCNLQNALLTSHFPPHSWCTCPHLTIVSLDMSAGDPSVNMR